MPRPSPLKGRVTKTTSMRLPVGLLEAMDDLIDLGLYKTKNQILTEALEMLYSNLALAMELRYLAEKRARDLYQGEEEIPASAVLEAMGQILKEREDLRRDPLMDAISKVLAKDPEKAYQVSQKLKEALKK